MNPHLQWLIEQATQIKRHVMVRTNLTVLDQEPYAHLPECYAEHKVEVIASLPYYTQKEAERMRGDGVFQTSIKVLQRLNELGYGL